MNAIRSKLKFINKMELNILFYGVFAALGYIILQSLFILGVRIAALGGTEVMPNGKDYDSEMILYPIFKYLTQKKNDKIFFANQQFEKLIKKIQILLPSQEIVTENETVLIKNNDKEGLRLREVLNEILPKIDLQIQIELTEEGLRFFKVYEKYRFSKYLRKPLIQCPICMASFWSIFSYWIPVVHFYGFNFWILYLGGINICAVACLNWMIFSRSK